MTGNKKLFLSTVSSEFLAYRELLTKDLKRPTLDVAVQEDFIVTGASTLEKLDDYIRACDGIIHLIGKATGAVAEEHAVAALLTRYPDFAEKLPPLAPLLAEPQPGFSYTQWEAYLAIYHQRKLFVYRPTDFDLAVLDVPRAHRFVFSADEEKSQKEHYARISALGHDRGPFLNEERLSSAVLRDLVEILPRLETTIDVSATKLPHAAERLIGRDEDLARLDAAWNDSHNNVVIIRAFGGMGKTSVVATWMAELALKNWRGAERIFDWSFYSQGTNDQSAASAESFIAAALTAFGDPDPVLGSAWDRGARLARLVGQVRCLLVLDGLEPLQYPPGPMEGKLKDPAIEALLKGLAAQNAGLCVVTTREKVPDIQQHYGRTAADLALTALTDLAGAALLHHHGATRAGASAIAKDDKELQTASREVRGHGLTLQLLGQYLWLAEDGDIRKRDTVRLADADHEYKNDATRPYGHAFKAIEAYENWFQREDERGQRHLAILRLLGLFDRPASKDCLDALVKAPAIDELTGPLVGLEQRDWKVITNRLAEINLVTVQADGGLDAHPLLREYFATKLRTQQPEAWKAAHRRLYEHLCARTEDKPDATLEDLQPLYQAVAHGCQAGLQQHACDTVFSYRVRRGKEIYSTRKLGAYGSDLGAIACFFETPWSRISPALTEAAQSWLLGEAAFCLRALGRLTEALDPLRVSFEMAVKAEDWLSASIGYSNLSDLELLLGDVAEAVRDFKQTVIYADLSGDAFQRSSKRASLANALSQAGGRAESEALFREAERMQAERRPNFPRLYSVSSFRYCDLLMMQAERASGKVGGRTPNDGWLEQCRAASRRATQMLPIAKSNNWLLDIALSHLTLGRAALYTAILEQSAEFSPLRPRNDQGDTIDRAGRTGLTAALQAATKEIAVAVSGIRSAGHQELLVPALLTRAWQRSLTGQRTGLESAQSDLDEAWEIAARGPMPLYLADIHLYRSRLFFRETNYPFTDPDGTPRTPQQDLADARRLIEKHGYGRRLPELEDAEAAINPPRG